jgi:hypothetical protein
VPAPEPDEEADVRDRVFDVPVPVTLPPHAAIAINGTSRQALCIMSREGHDVCHWGAQRGTRVLSRLRCACVCQTARAYDRRRRSRPFVASSHHREVAFGV